MCAEELVHFSRVVVQLSLFILKAVSDAVSTFLSRITDW